MKNHRMPMCAVVPSCLVICSLICVSELCSPVPQVDDKILDAIIEKCKYFFELEKFMGSRPNNNPPFLGDSEDGMGDAEAHLLTADVIEAEEEPVAPVAPAGPGATAAPAGPAATAAPAGPGSTAAPAGPRMRGTTDKRKRRLQRRNIDHGGLDARDLEEAGISKEDSEDEDDSKRRKKCKPQSVPEIMQSLTKSKESKDDKKLEIQKMKIELRMSHKVQELEFRREEKKAEIELRKMERESETELRRAELEARKLEAENQRETIRQMATRQVNN